MRQPVGPLVVAAAKSLPNRVDLIYSFEANEYNGRTSLQLNLKDVRPTGSDDGV